MPTSRWRWVALLALVTIISVSQGASAAEFSADVVTSTAHGSMTNTIYVKGLNLRTEMGSGQRRQIMILNSDKKMLWFLDPQQKTYWSEKLQPDALAKMRDALRHPQLQFGKGSKTKRLGTETVNGYVCEKRVVEGQGFTATVWQSKKLDLPIKLEMTGRGGTVRQEYRNIKERTLPASLFLPPKDYKQVTHPQPRSGMAPGGGRRGMRSRSAAPPPTRRR